MTFMMRQGSNGSFNANQENKPPEELAAAKKTAVGAQAYTPVASPVSRGLGLTPRAFPVKNTFIHYGTPVSTAPRTLASPKTVPPNFAPEQHEEEKRAAAIPEDRLPPFSLSYLAPPCGRPPTAPGPSAAAGQPLQGPRGQGIAPLKLFDYLPSPKVHPQAQQMASLVPQMPPVPGMPGTQAPPGVAQPQVLLGAGGCGGHANCGTCNFCSCCGAMPWQMQQMPPLPMPQMPLPPPMPPMAPSQPFVSMTNFGCPQESFTSAMGWAPWPGGSDYSYGPPAGAPRPADAGAPGAVGQVMQNAPMMPQQVQPPPLPTLRIDLQLQQP